MPLLDDLPKVELHCHLDGALCNELLVSGSVRAKLSTPIEREKGGDGYWLFFSYMWLGSLALEV